MNYKFDGVEYSITIEEVAVFPQGYAALMTETGLLQDEPSMLLMDLGGWTVDLMRIDNAIPAADTAHSLELGMIRCVDDIREQVRRETGLSLTDAQIENMLAGQPCTVSDVVRGIVNQQGRKYTEHLLSATMEAGFDLHAIPAVLLGGGASVAYAIGEKDPVMVDVNTFGTGICEDDCLAAAVRKAYDLTPAGIIKQLNLLNPIYSRTAAGGHFGREDFPWENVEHMSDLAAYIV